jgi:hypothetical protein
MFKRFLYATIEQHGERLANGAKSEVRLELDPSKLKWTPPFATTRKHKSR